MVISLIKIKRIANFRAGIRENILSSFFMFFSVAFLVFEFLVKKYVPVRKEVAISTAIAGNRYMVRCAFRGVINRKTWTKLAPFAKRAAPTRRLIFGLVLLLCANAWVADVEETSPAAVLVTIKLCFLLISLLKMYPITSIPVINATINHNLYGFNISIFSKIPRLMFADSNKIFIFGISVIKYALFGKKGSITRAIIA